MTDKIKEKLLKEIGNFEPTGPIENIIKELKEENDKLRDFKEISYEQTALLIFYYLGRLEQHEETSKAKDEEFVKILDKLQDDINVLQAEIIRQEFKEIKQRIKEDLEEEK